MSEGPSRREGADSHVWRESAAIGLYLAIVLLAVHLGLGGDRRAGEDLRLMLGTSLGLGVAHIFAFSVTAMLASGGKFAARDRAAFVAIALTVVAIAVLESVPYVFLSDADDASSASALVLWVVIGVTVYGRARGEGADARRAIVFTAITLVVAAGVVVTKFVLTH